MCPDRNPPPRVEVSPSVPVLPPALKVSARTMGIVGVATCVASLRMPAAYLGFNNCNTYPTWYLISAAVVFSLIVAVAMPWLPLIGLWFWAGALTCVITVFRPGGPMASLLGPLLSSGLLAGWILASAGFDARCGHDLYGGVVFAVGCSLMFISTLPGLYYWIKLRLPGRKKNGTF